MPNTPGQTWQAQARSTFREVFLEHPRSLSESYWQHQAHATRFGATLIASGVACLIHGIVPALYPRTASNTVASLYEQMLRMRRVTPALRTTEASASISDGVTAS